MELSPTLRKRLEAKLVKGPSINGCWIFTGCRAADGYGILRNSKPRVIKAHRAAWILAHGLVPAGLLVCHHCDVPLCCNPGHLFLGTAADNWADCVSKGRTASGEKNGAYTKPESIRHGENHGRAKLREQDVRNIRAEVENGEKKAHLARRYSVSTTVIGHICARKLWKHIA